MNFVEINTDSFGALIPGIRDLAISDVMPMLDAIDPLQKAHIAINLLRSQIAPELQEKFDELTTKQVEELVGQWIARSV
jgi:hypothetical protein